MLKYFPILTEDKIKKFTESGYMFVFRYMKAIEEVRVTDLIHKSEIEDEYRVVPLQSGHRIEKIVPFDEGYKFLKESDLQYNIYCSPVFEEVYNWNSYYNLSDDEDEEHRRNYLDELYFTIGREYKS